MTTTPTEVGGTATDDERCGELPTRDGSSPPSRTMGLFANPVLRVRETTTGSATLAEVVVQVLADAPIGGSATVLYGRGMESALVVTVDELAPVVDRWRLATVPSAPLGAPAHVTILYPWVDPPIAATELDRLAGLLADVSPATMTFDRVDRFPNGVLYLALDAESEQRWRSLTGLVRSAYPSHVPYAGEHPDPTPHLTIAMADDEIALDRITEEVSTSLGSVLPHTAPFTELTVMAQDTDDRWHRAHRLPLGH